MRSNRPKGSGDDAGTPNPPPGDPGVPGAPGNPESSGAPVSGSGSHHSPRRIPDDPVPAGQAPGSEWLRGDGPSSDVVISSRVRLARNFAGFKFVARCTRAEKQDVLQLARTHITGAGLAQNLIWADLTQTSELERNILVERHLISHQHAKGTEPRAAAVSLPDERLAIMVNEEDHLRIQVIRAGLALGHAFAQISDVDDRIESRADFAFSPRWGYLTACPTNVGTGIRVSVMLHLPALKLTGEIEKVKRAAGAMNLAIRGFYGEGSEAIGDLFQLSNQTTLGKCEKDILGEFEHDVVPKVIEYERVARRTLTEKRRVYLEDQLYRAMGVLTHARLMKSDEAMQALSMIRLGACLGVFPGITAHKVHELMLLTQPAHLQRAAKQDLDQSERRIERARLLRRSLGD